MDVGVIVTAAIFVVICSVPIILSIRRRSNIESQLLKSLRDAANHQGCNITNHEICGDYAIGADDEKGYLFFKKKEELGKDTAFINLAFVQDCTLTNITRTIKTDGDVYHVTDKLSLDFVPKPGYGHNGSWVFFNAESHRQLNGELQSTEKWSKLIKEKLKGINH